MHRSPRAFLSRYGRYRRHPAGPGTVIIFGLIFAVFGILFHAWTSIPSGDTAQVNGTIVQVVWNSDGDGGPTCAPIASYEVAGQAYQTGPPSDFVGPCPYSRGQSIALYYNPSDPSQSAVPPTTLEVVMVWLTIAIGIAIIGCGVRLELRRRAGITAAF